MLIYIIYFILFIILSAIVGHFSGKYFTPLWNNFCKSYSELMWQSQQMKIDMIKEELKNKGIEFTKERWNLIN